MAIINKLTLETLAQDDDGMLYVQKQDTINLFNIPLFQHILNTTNQELISKFRVRDSQSRPIGFLNQKEKTNEDKD